MMMDALTLDQFHVFVAVVEAGSFSEAGRRLNRAQSAITYAIQKLEEQVETELFDRTVYRPTLSPSGLALLPQARRILDDVGRFRIQAREIKRGLETGLHLSLGALVPVGLLAPAFAAFADAYPSVRLRIGIQPFSLDVRDGAGSREPADIHVVFGMLLPDTMVKRVIGAITLIDVAAPSHPLAALAGPLGAETLRDHLQIVLTEGTKAPADKEIGVAAANTWRVTDLAAKHALLLAGIGWGRLPDALVADDLAAGRLVHLPTEDWNDNGALRRITLVAAYRRDEPLGPAGRWLLARLGGGEDAQPPVS